MNDTYSELLIKKEVTAKDKMIKVLLIALIALMAVAGILITPLAFIAAIALGIAAYFVFPNLDLEFEYVFWRCMSITESAEQRQNGMSSLRSSFAGEDEEKKSQKF